MNKTTFKEHGEYYVIDRMSTNGSAGISNIRYFIWKRVISKNAIEFASNMMLLQFSNFVIDLDLDKIVKSRATVTDLIYTFIDTQLPVELKTW